jgi:hypothetical protein
MFSEMIAGLGQGVLPDPGPLRGRCHAAITKKLAFVRLPPVYWETDPKRNPDSSHLLWAVLLLGDKEMLGTLEGIVLMEQGEREGLSWELFMKRSLDGLFDLAPDSEFRALLQQHISC